MDPLNCLIDNSTEVDGNPLSLLLSGFAEFVLSVLETFLVGDSGTMGRTVGARAHVALGVFGLKFLMGSKSLGGLNFEIMWASGHCDFSGVCAFVKVVEWMD